MNIITLKKIIHPRNSIRQCAVALAAMAGLAGSAWATPTINVKFGNTGAPLDTMNGKAFIANNYQQAPAPYAGTAWNDFFRNDETGLVAITGTALLDSEGNATGVGFTTNTTPPNANWLMGPRVMGNQPDVRMLNSGLYRVTGSGSGNTTNSRLIVSGLDQAKLYHIYLACSSEILLNNRWGIGTATAAPATTKDILNKSASKTAQTWKPGDNWLVFYNVAPDALGKIYVWGYNLMNVNGYSGLTLNGFQVVDATGWQNSDKSIYDFAIPALTGSYSVISDNGTGNNITVNLPYGTTDRTALTPTFTLADGATCLPASNTLQDFSSPVDYTVTAQDGTTKVYQVTAHSERKILTFSWVTPNGVTSNAAINEANHTVVLKVPFGTERNGLIPTCTVSAGASVSPLSNIAQDFTSPVTYTVTGEDGGTQDYQVSVIHEAPIVSPSGYNPITGTPWQIGDKYQLVFVSSTTKSNAETTMPAYNTFVNAVAATSTLPGVKFAKWYAIGTARDDAATNPARVNATVAYPVYLVDGATMIATGYADMWDGSIANGINLNQNGAAVAAGTQVWTGSNISGTGQKTFYNDYSQYGRVGDVNAGWINYGDTSPGSKVMYALSEPLTIMVNQPSMTVTLGISDTTLTEVEGSQHAATLTATLSAVSSQIVTVNLAFSGTAKFGTDYTCATSIVIPADTLSASIPLTAVTDALFENVNETVVVDINTVLNALENATPQRVTATIIDGNTQPTVLPSPTGINPVTLAPWNIGDKYHLLFITSTTISNVDKNIATYNTFVNAAAATSTLPGIPNILWYAIGTAQNDAATAPAHVNALVTAPVYLVDGVTRIANSYTDMWDGAIANPIHLNQNGAIVAAGTYVWTGSNTNGTGGRTFYGDYSDVGKVGDVNFGWIQNTNTNNGLRPMYALSMPLTVTVAPPEIKVTLGISSADPLAENGGAATLTATLSQTTTQDVTVNLAFSGTATFAVDYTCATSIVIPANSLSASIPLTAVGDAIYEGANETIVVDIDTVVNGLEDGIQQVTATILEDDAQPVIAAPTGINPSTGLLWKTGDKYHLVFVTSTSTAATNAAIVYYNTFVNTAAGASGLPGVPNIVWYAIASATNDPAAPANVNALVTGPVYLVDGSTLVATGYADMWDDSIANPINLNESGVAAAAGTRAWAGSLSDGTSYKPMGKSDGYVEYGLAASTDGQWLNSNEQQNGVARMYALSMPLAHAGGGAMTYDLWKTINAGGQDADMDYNHDGVANGVAYFMGIDGLATLPTVVGGKVTWPHVNAGASFEVQVSNNLADWAPADPLDVDTTSGVPGEVIYTLPTGATKKFCRLVVTPN